MKHSKYVVGYLVIIDALGIALAMMLSYYVRVAGNIVPYFGPQDTAAYVQAALMTLPVWLIVHGISQLYSLDSLFDGMDEYVRVLRASTFGIVALVFASFLDRRTQLSRGWVLITWLSCIVFVIGGRFLFRRWVYLSRAHGRLVTEALIIGVNEHAKALARQLQQTPNAGTKVIGFLDDHLPVGAAVMDGLAVLGPPRDIEYLIGQTKAEEVIIVPEALAWESLQEIVQRTSSIAPLGVRMRLSPGVYEILTTGLNMSHKASIPLLTIHDIRITGSDAVLKAVVDYTWASILLAVSAPFMLLAAIAAKVSGAPRIFDRRRVLGLKGVPFTQLRFYTGANAGNRRTLARDSLRLDAHRFSGLVGRVLYATGFDKAPQLWNVLRGEMSLVGARAVSATDLSAPGAAAPTVLTVKPGMTGLWAVTDDTTHDYELLSTLYYIRNWSTLLDLQILLRTISVALSGRLKKMDVEGDERQLISLSAITGREATAESGS